MKTWTVVLALVAGVFAVAGPQISGAQAHDRFGRQRYGGHAGHRHNSGYYQPVVRNQVVFSTGRFSIGFGSPAVVRPYRTRAIVVPHYDHHDVYYVPEHDCDW